MMDGAYFTGRKEILEWINVALSIGLTKIEQTATGAVACGLLDAHFPGSVVMSKVNWDCRNEYEYTSNYKTLQAAFNKLNIRKKAEIEKLSRGKYQDNLEVGPFRQHIDATIYCHLALLTFSNLSVFCLESNSSCSGSKGFAQTTTFRRPTTQSRPGQKAKVRTR
jgi:hypothetical protein